MYMFNENTILEVKWVHRPKVKNVGVLKNDRSNVIKTSFEM